MTMGPRAKRLLDETLRFLAVGGVATFVAFLLFNFLVHGFSITDEPWMNEQPTMAYVLANTIGMVISYRGTRSWAFKNRETAHADGGRTAYLVINVATMALPIGCLWISRNLLDHDSAFADNIAANVVGLGLGMVARFYLFRQVIFSQKNYAPATLAGTSAMPLPGNCVLPRGAARQLDDATGDSGSPEVDPRLS
ncbi:GtrA family protein [Nocardioides sp. JQ2195]|uniref:GtrA family protein n=1 Tax=Nocardioides sp. JQ2195 TaxID=2592334 RepID=UPI00143E7EDD|nr:GtrA family protein [Nocardioides sp. JQ2195]QIX25914.1 GtrA family protein [Nocardioides sp. JQ2195]